MILLYFSRRFSFNAKEDECEVVARVEAVPDSGQGIGDKSGSNGTPFIDTSACG